MNASSTTWSVVAAGMIAALVTTPAQAQIGALAATAAVVGAGGSDSQFFEGAPVFAENGLVLGQGWAVGAFGTSVRRSDAFVESTGTGFTVGAFAAVGSRAMVGASVQPVVRNEVVFAPTFDFPAEETFEQSGAGNLTLFGKAAVYTSDAGTTQLAVSGQAALPLADPWGQARSSLFAGLGVSHQLNSRTSVHGGAGVAYNGESDGEGDELNSTPIGSSTGFGANAALVLKMSEKAWLSGEFLFQSAEELWVLTAAPALRLQAGEGLFVDIGLAFGAAESDLAFPMDYGVALGATYVPRR